jgi:hypothetical protein
MRVWLYCICRDELRIMPYFLRHYTPWVERLFFYDDRSIDGTRDIIKACPKAELRDWPGEHGLVDDQFLEFANEVWKEARGHADYVVFVDADEFLYHPNITELLSRYLAEGVEMPQILGFTMVSKVFPTTTGQIYEEVRTGFPDDVWNKPAIFRKAMWWTVGRHGPDYAQFQPRASATPEIKLLHYRALGMEYVRWRHGRNWARVPERCRQMNLGTNTAPGYVGHHGLAWFEEVLSKDWPDVVS